MKNKFVIVTPIRVPVGFDGYKLTKQSKQEDFCYANRMVKNGLFGGCATYNCFHINCVDCMFHNVNKKFFKEWKQECFKGYRKSSLQKIK